MRLRLRLALYCVGGAVGAIAWAIIGIGLAELGALEFFDPAGVLEDPGEQSLLGQIAERSLPAYVVLGALLGPPGIAWLTRPPNPPPES